MASVPTTTRPTLGSSHTGSSSLTFLTATSQDDTRTRYTEVCLLEPRISSQSQSTYQLVPFCRGLSLSHTHARARGRGSLLFLGKGVGFPPFRRHPARSSPPGPVWRCRRSCQRPLSLSRTHTPWLMLNCPDIGFTFTRMGGVHGCSKAALYSGDPPFSSTPLYPPGRRSSFRRLSSAV